MKTIHYLLLAAGLCVLTSACDDESSEGARLTFEPALESLEFTTEGGSQTFLLYSNVPEWSIRCRYGDEWIDVWPAEGDFDGRFSVTVDENDRAELRYDHLEIYAGGELMRTLEVGSRRRACDCDEFYRKTGGGVCCFVRRVGDLQRRMACRGVAGGRGMALAGRTYRHPVECRLRGQRHRVHRARARCGSTFPERRAKCRSP